jgi:hypothetical protein
MKLLILLEVLAREHGECGIGTVFEGGRKPWGLYSGEDIFFIFVLVFLVVHKDSSYLLRKCMRTRVRTHRRVAGSYLLFALMRRSRCELGSDYMRTSLRKIAALGL